MPSGLLSSTMTTSMGMFLVVKDVLLVCYVIDEIEDEW